MSEGMRRVQFGCLAVVRLIILGIFRIRRDSEHTVLFNHWDVRQNRLEFFPFCSLGCRHKVIRQHQSLFEEDMQRDDSRMVVCDAVALVWHRPRHSIGAFPVAPICLQGLSGEDGHLAIRVPILVVLAEEVDSPCHYGQVPPQSLLVLGIEPMVEDHERNFCRSAIPTKVEVNVGVLLQRHRDRRPIAPRGISTIILGSVSSK
mmetsp:Transcript_101016/g.253270  ORF Transcript_101016/g.253270 Transcript_101016/m.253270 type:complete len:203 (-) Transcript_101016:1267-1875(-)